MRRGFIIFNDSKLEQDELITLWLIFPDSWTCNRESSIITCSGMSPSTRVSCKGLTPSMPSISGVLTRWQLSIISSMALQDKSTQNRDQEETLCPFILISFISLKGWSLSNPIMYIYSHSAARPLAKGLLEGIQKSKNL